jgi:hypothetical protein
MDIRRHLTVAALVASLVPAVAGVALRGAVREQECKEAATCRQLAAEAKERKDFDAFHDLAWKAMSLGPRNDSAAMTQLARAQSLSGRPLDALVMLQRLAAMGVFTDVATSDDFERVRALPSWGELEATLTGKPGSPSVSAAPPVAPKNPATAKTEKPPAEKPTVAENPPVTEPVPSPPPPTAPPAARTTKGGKTPADPLRFSGAGVNAVGLAYDAVSGRFIIGDRADHRLLVVGERSGRLASLAGVDEEVTALEIDAREGDLWVVSAASATHVSTVHKLQLISGRVLSSIALTAEHAPARFTDVAVTPQSILILDSEGRRIFRAAKKGRTLDVAMRLAVAGTTVLAPASDGVVFVAYDRGLLRADLATRTMSVVEPGAKADLAGIVWMRAFRGSLVAIQQGAQGPSRLVRIRLDDTGRTARAVDVLEENVALAGSTSAALTDNVLYYLNRASDSGDVIVRKLLLK